MATITMRLDETDIGDAIDMWVRAKGMVPQGRASLTVTQPEWPHDSATYAASIEAEMAPSPNPQPARARSDRR